MRNLRVIATLVGATLGVIVVVVGGAGCAPEGADAKAAGGKRSASTAAAAAATPAGTSDLNAGYAYFAGGQYDQALGVANQYLAAHPTGARGTAEALYLKGRVYEQRAETAARDANAVGSATALQSARDAYAQALSASPTPGAEVRLLMGLANV